MATPHIVPVPPALSKRGMCGSCPTMIASCGARASRADVCVQLPSLSFTPATTPGKAVASRTTRSTDNGTADTCGRWYSTSFRRGSATRSITCAYQANRPSSVGCFQKNGGSTRQAAVPLCTAWRVSATVSVRAAQPVAATIRRAGTSAASSASSPTRRSSSENDWPSPVVPNGAMPSTPCAKRRCTWAAKRAWSTAPSRVSGVSVAHHRPRRGWVFVLSWS